MAQIKVKQVKSTIKRIKIKNVLLKHLGLRGIGKEVIHESYPKYFGNDR